MHTLEGSNKSKYTTIKEENSQTDDVNMPKLIMQDEGGEANLEDKK